MPHAKKKVSSAASSEFEVHDLVMLDVAKLRPHPKNPRRHPASQVDGLARAYGEFGTTSVLVVDEDRQILAGHARVDAARASGITKFPGFVVKGWDEKRKVAFMVADNQHPTLADWDADLLREHLISLQGSWDDFAALGFDQEALSAALAKPGAGRTDPDAAPPLPEKPIVRVGDLWLLGQHRLLCGDATNKRDVERLLDGAKPRLMVVDPPYGVDYDPAWRPNAGVGSYDTARGAVMNDDRADWTAAWELFPGDVAYVWHGGLHGSVVQQSLAKVGLTLRAQIIWVKHRPALSRGHYHWQHEPSFYAVRDGKDDGWRFDEDHEAMAYAVREGKTHGWTGDKRQSTVWFIEHLKNDTGHGTQKPVECMRRPMLNNSKAGALVYDPFVGSGTTIIAAEELARRCLALDLDPRYVQVAIERWQAFTGGEAVLVGGATALPRDKSEGQPFAKVARARRSGMAVGGKDEAGGRGDAVQGADVVRPVAKSKVRSRRNGRLPASP